MSDHERRVYLNHIRRLQEKNRVLGEMLAAERIARQRAYAWYYQRLNSRLWWLFDAMLMHSGKAGRAALVLIHWEALGE